VAASVLDTVLAQLNMSSNEYFARLEKSLDAARDRRVQRAVIEKEIESVIHHPIAHDFMAPTVGVEDDELIAVVPEEGAGSTEAGRTKAKERRAKTRAGRIAPEEEEIGEVDVEGGDEEDSQFRLAYRRAMRHTPRRIRDR